MHVLWSSLKCCTNSAQSREPRGSRPQQHKGQTAWRATQHLYTDISSSYHKELTGHKDLLLAGVQETKCRRNKQLPAMPEWSRYGQSVSVRGLCVKRVDWLRLNARSDREKMQWSPQSMAKPCCVNLLLATPAPHSKALLFATGSR